MADAFARTLAVALFAVSTSVAAGQRELAGSARRQGDALAAALLREDYASVAATACSPVLARVGGTAALARQIEVGFRVMQQQGRRLVAMRFGAATAVFDGAVTRFALLPYRSVVELADGRLSVESYYLAVRDIGADDWCFIDIAALTPETLRQMYPGAPPGLHLPMPSTPVLEARVP